MHHTPLNAKSRKDAPLRGVSGIVIGWFATCYHEYPEPEGNLYFKQETNLNIGDTVELPSDGSEWTIIAINRHDNALRLAQPANTP